MPASSDAHPYLDHPHPVAIAHRGGTEAAPENSLAAFRAATEVGLRYLETDVHLTSDGVLVAFHDEHLDRVTDADGAVAELPWNVVGRARIGGSEPIPTLDELLETFPEARFNIDAKSDHCVLTLVSTLRRHDALDRVCLGAFSDARLRRLRSLLGPDVCTSAGPREVAALVGAARLRQTPGRVPSHACVQVPVRHLGVEVVTAAFVELVHRSGGRVQVWTIDDPEEMHRLLDLGVDGIFTDRPSVLRSVLEDRGQWS